MKVLDIDWAVHVLKRIKGLDFPAAKEDIRERLRGLIIKGKKGEEIAEVLSYPVNSPAKLLHEIKEHI